MGLRCLTDQNLIIVFYPLLYYGYFLFLAYEILGNKLKRRSYDSVDPQFDNDVPPADEESKKNFFKVFGPVFERNSR